MCVLDETIENGARLPTDQPTPDAETDLNLEVSFAEQALSYRERSKGVESQKKSEADDKLPVRVIKH